MALEFNAYLAPKVVVAMGAPLHMDARVSAIARDVAGIEEEWTYDNPSRPVILSVVKAAPAVHQAIQALSGVTTIFPVVSATLAQIRTHAGTPVVAFGTAWASALRTSLEAFGIDTSWASADTTLQELLRRLVRTHAIAQEADFADGSAVRSFLAANLDATVGSLPAAVRNGARTWLEARGVNLSWVTGTSTVRAVLAKAHEQYPHRSVALAGLEVF